MAKYLNDLLPLPRKDGYSIEPDGGIIKSQMESGTARQRRTTTSSTSAITVRWSFTNREFAVFQAWVKHDALYGAAWFDIDLLSGLGLVTHEARFVDKVPYKGSINTNTNKWDVTARLEVKDEATLSLGGYELTKKYTLDDILETQLVMTNSVNTFLSKI